MKFAKGRDLYREMLRERLGHFGIPLLGYCLAMWTECMAVGGRSYAEEIEAALKNRRRVETVETETGSGIWMVREEPPLYA